MEYRVYYRTGGTVNFKWHYAAGLYTREKAIKQVAVLERAGYRAHYELAERIESIGLPETFQP